MVLATFNRRCQARIESPSCVSVCSSQTASSRLKRQQFFISRFSRWALSLFCLSICRSRAASTRCRVSHLCGVVPVSALKGWNVVEPHSQWCGYEGPSLLQILELLPNTAMGGAAAWLCFAGVYAVCLMVCYALYTLFVRRYEQRFA